MSTAGPALSERLARRLRRSKDIRLSWHFRGGPKDESCSDLQGSDQSRVLIAQQPETAFRLPDGVAYTLTAQQYLTLELHYINTTDQVLDVEGRVEFLLADEPSESLIEATMNFT